ncbi:hypothetical protein A4A71_07995 [Nicoletella semolina]|uniref:ubiquinone biosynthesis accessory factor UbiJ n=1 Tax=Nicoletella semolina TaxID=271160 RepID=UPI001052C329|nr:SCP2 sterol-binding domain-containing protein [Nicoletella semolina]MDH2925258.1 hypothetical protein [Nicoletella semolina]
MMTALLRQFMLPQLAIGTIETVFNLLLQRSGQTLPILRKLADKTLKVELISPNITLFILFSETRTEWLNQYSGTPDCTITLASQILPKLRDRQHLATLINQQSVILQGDLQLLQQFSRLLDELETDPAELLSPIIGDVLAQASTNVVKMLFNRCQQQFSQQSHYLAENLTTEFSVVVHRLQIADFCDQVSELAQQAVKLEQKIAKLDTQRSSRTL